MLSKVCFETMRGHVNSAGRKPFERYKKSRAGNLKLPTLDGFRSSIIFLSCIQHDHLLPPQPLFPVFFLTVSASSSAAFLAFSSADCSSVFLCSIFCCCSVLTAFPLEVSGPLPAEGMACFSVPPALVLAPHPLPAWAPGSVIPPMLINPATPKEASNFFRSFFSMVSSLENWLNGYRTNQLIFLQLLIFSIIQF